MLNEATKTPSKRLEFGSPQRSSPFPPKVRLRSTQRKLERVSSFERDKKEMNTSEVLMTVIDWSRRRYIENIAKDSMK